MEINKKIKSTLIVGAYDSCPIWASGSGSQEIPCYDYSLITYNLDVVSLLSTLSAIMYKIPIKTGSKKFDTGLLP